MSLDKQDHWLNQKQMAASLGVSARAFQEWGVEPVAKIGRESFYEAKSVLANRIERAEQSITPDNSELALERLRLTKAQAENLEIKNEQLKALVCPIEIIQVVLSRVSGEAAGILDSIPLDIRRKHPTLDNQITEDIKRHIVKAQNAVARCDDVLEQTLSDYIEQDKIL